MVERVFRASHRDFRCILYPDKCWPTRRNERIGRRTHDAAIDDRTGILYAARRPIRSFLRVGQHLSG